MKEFIYDNTFEGLLTAIFYAYPEKEECIITPNKMYLPNLLFEAHNITTEGDKFNRVYKSIEEKLTFQVLKNIYYLYLSSHRDSKTLALQYLKLCYRYGSNVNLAKNNDIIIKVDRYCKQVSYEAHRFTGFVRFKEIGHLTFYSSIAPDHNILPLLINHFTKRFSDEYFIIHDTKREMAIIYDKKSAIITDFSNEQASLLTSANSDYKFESLWKTFYKSVNIEDRKNHRLRNQYMPKRYWDNLTELKP